MSRPYYECEQDLAVESEIADRICRKCNWQYRKLPLAYGFDFGFFERGRMKVIAEIKRRHINHDHYTDIILSARKAKEGLSWTQLNPIPYFIIEFDDGIYKHRLRYDNNYVIKWGGRHDRSDWQDEEPVFMIPISMFAKVDA